MLRRCGTIHVVSFLMFATCVASCQSVLPHHITSKLPFREQSSLPDAPYPAPTKAEDRRGFAGLEPLSNTPVNEQVFVRAQLDAMKLSAPKQSEVSTFLVRYLSPPTLKQNSTHAVSTSGGVMERTLSAVSPVLITHDISGKARPNTVYLLQVLTSAVFHSAYRPYRARTPSATFDGFRSTIGGDAGGQVFHEFEPDIRQVVKHLKLVSRIEQHLVAHSQPAVK